MWWEGVMIYDDMYVINVCDRMLWWNDMNMYGGGYEYELGGVHH